MQFMIKTSVSGEGWFHDSSNNRKTKEHSKQLGEAISENSKVFYSLDMSEFRYEGMKGLESSG